MKIEQNGFYSLYPSTKGVLKRIEGVEKQHADKDVYKFQVQADDLQELFDLVKSYDVVRTDKLNSIDDNVSGKDIVAKLLGANE